MLASTNGHTFLTVFLPYVAVIVYSPAGMLLNTKDLAVAVATLLSVLVLLVG